MLRALKATLDINAPFEACIWAMTPCAFWGMIRFGEVAVASCSSFDGSRHLKRSDALLSRDNDGKPYARLDLPTAKTARPGEMQSVFMIALGDLCPLQALRNLAAVVPAAPDDPLFSWRDTNGEIRPMTKARALERVNKILGAWGWGTTFGHSFRIGGASFYLAQGVNPEIGIRAGRIKTPASARRSLGVAVPGWGARRKSAAGGAAMALIPDAHSRSWSILPYRSAMSHNAGSLIHSPLLHLPLEIIELIVLNVVGLSNLLSLSLTCRVLASILFSGHIQYHTVRAPIGCVDIWKHLIRNHTYARNVRHLEIISNLTRAPSSFRPVKFLEDRVPDNGQYPPDPPSPSNQRLSKLERKMWREGFLVIALRGMSNLRSFAWLRGCPPTLSGYEDIWGALRRKQYLSDVKLHEIRYHRSSNIRSFLDSPISTTFFGLVRFDLTCVAIPFQSRDILLTVVDLLVSHCPYLEASY
ncbi:hypothetical protein JB92DRAFT_3112397 [Gautieria morchelliformis]|nr:hypothetical protein JB92DRAFT_3112397 [Gautieria morchelliformis]